jgi:hypothetical protein
MGKQAHVQVWVDSVMGGWVFSLYIPRSPRVRVVPCLGVSYVSKASARRAACRVAKQLGIEVEG